MVVLTTPTTLKVDGIVSWVHWSHTHLSDSFALQENYCSETWEASKHPPTPKGPAQALFLILLMLMLVPAAPAK